MMIKKIFFLFAIGSFLLVSSCKKADQNVAPEANPTLATETLSEPNNDAIKNNTSTPVTNQTNVPTETTVVNNGVSPVMTFEKKEHDFGIINEGDKVFYIFNFKNTGKTNLIIASAQGSCGCTIPEYPKDPLKPGESGKMKVSFNSEGKSGNQQKSVTINANTATGKEMLTIKASVTPKDKK